MENTNKVQGYLQKIFESFERKRTSMNLNDFIEKNGKKWYN